MFHSLSHGFHKEDLLVFEILQIAVTHIAVSLKVALAESSQLLKSNL
jgi:hypothetical protein